MIIRKIKGLKIYHKYKKKKKDKNVNKINVKKEKIYNMINSNEEKEYEINNKNKVVLDLIINQKARKLKKKEKQEIIGKRVRPGRA